MSGARARGVEPGQVGSFEPLTGKGVSGEVEGRSVVLGNRALLEQQGIDPGELAEQAETLRADGQTVMVVAADRQPLGLLGVADPIKETTPDAIHALHQEGLRLVMLTGDSETTARAVAATLGIDDVIAGVLPEQKAEQVKELQAEGRRVAMAGDGINDAPALAQAHIITHIFGFDVDLRAERRVRGQNPERVVIQSRGSWNLENHRACG